MRFCFFLLFSCAILCAAPGGNPSFPHLIDCGFFIPRQFPMKIRVGYEGDFVFDGNMKQVQEGSGSVDEYGLSANTGTFTLNFIDRFDFYTALGASRFDLQWRFVNVFDEAQTVHAETENDFLWAVGLRAILWKHRCWTLGANGRYSETTNQLQWLTINGGNASTRGGSLSQRIWSGNLGIAYRVDFLLPYLAVNFEQVRSKICSREAVIAPGGSLENHFQNKIPVGINLGCTLSTGRDFMLNVEARLINEEAVTVSGDIQF